MTCRRNVECVSTHHISEEADTLCSRGSEVTRDDALDTDFLRGAEDLPLLADDPSIDGADKDVDALQELLELLVVVGQVPDADLDPGRLQLLSGGLRHGRRADSHDDPLQTQIYVQIMLCRRVAAVHVRSPRT